MKIIVCYAPTDQDLFANARIVRFTADTEYQIEAYCESLGSGVTSLVIDTEKAEPMEEAMSLSTVLLTGMHNALSSDEPKVGKPRVRSDGVRRLYDRIVHLAKHTEPMIWNVQPTIVDRDEHTSEMIANADCFYVTAFRGQPKGFDKKQVKTLDEARVVAVDMYLDRPVAIYAVRGGRQVLVCNFSPGDTTMSDNMEQTQVEPAKTPKEPKAPREVKLGEFKQVRQDTNLSKIVSTMLTGTFTAEEIGSDHAMTGDQVMTHLRRARVTHGINHAVAEDKTVSLILPYDVDSTNVFKAPAEAKEAKEPSGERKPRTDKAMEAAKTGVMPTEPDFSASTHKPYRKKLDALRELVANRDVDGLRGYSINPISTSPRALIRYRDCAIAAIEAQDNPERQAAE